MKKIIRNTLIYLFALTGIPAVRRWWLKRSGPLVRVLAYHDVPQEDAGAFEKQIVYLKNKYNILTSKEFGEGITPLNNSIELFNGVDTDRGVFSREKINILLTFDDGYRSWVEVVLPILQKYNLGGFFFICSGFVDTAGNEEREKEFCKEHLEISHRPPLSWEQVQQIDRASHCEIGGHTRTHPRLADLSYTDALHEISEDKKVIEDRLGHSIKHFAYPYGKKKDVGHANKVVQEAGYAYTFSTEIDFARQQKPIPRTMVSPYMSVSLLTHFVGGVYDVKLI